MPWISWKHCDISGTSLRGHLDHTGLSFEQLVARLGVAVIS